MFKLGCLFFLMLLAWLAAEIWVMLAVGRVLKSSVPEWVGTGWFEALMLLVATSVLGVAIASWNLARLQGAMLEALTGKGGNRVGLHLVGAVGGILLAIPGFISDALALILLLPPMPWILASLGRKVMFSIIRQKMGAFMGQGMPGAAGPFPGMRPRDPAGFPARPKTYDTVAEKVPDKPDDSISLR